MRCPGSLAMEAPFPNSDTDYSREGTAAHELASWALTDGRYDTAAYCGRVAPNGVEITDEMCEYVQEYVDNIRLRVQEFWDAGAVSVELMVEQRVDYSRFIGQPDSFGTSDVIILVTWKDGTSLIDVHDLKYGFRTVYAEKNEQMGTYALGAIAEYDLAYNFTRAAMTIHMPRKDFVDTWECDVSELMEFANIQRMQAAEAARIMQGYEEKRAMLGAPYEVEVAREFLKPSKKGCEWCKAKATCPALRDFVQDTVAMDFDDLTAAPVDHKQAAELSTMEQLENNLTAVPMVEEWYKAQRIEIERRLLGGESSSQFKIVAGKKGNRAWSVKDEAETLLKSMRLKIEEMYKMELISPTTAEKLLKKESPRRWKKLQDLIVQKDGPASVVPMSDKREALVFAPTADDFEELPEADSLC